MLEALVPMCRIALCSSGPFSGRKCGAHTEASGRGEPCVATEEGGSAFGLCPDLGTHSHAEETSRGTK
jgi:hypothetical protein